jgi:hypothetical protein
MISSVQGGPRRAGVGCARRGVPAGLRRSVAVWVPAARRVVVQGERLHPGGEFCCQEDDIDPNAVGVEAVQGQVAQPGVFRGAVAAFAAGTAAVPQLQVRCCPWGVPVLLSASSGRATGGPQAVAVHGVGIFVPR